MIVIGQRSHSRKRLIYMWSVAVAIGLVLKLITHKTLIAKLHETISKFYETEFYEQPTLLNITSFSWKRLNRSFCDHNPVYPKDTRIMPVLIHSARDHFNERLAIRKSWGSVPLYKKWDVRLVFLLGEQDPCSKPEVPNEKQLELLENKLTAEQNMYGDIVSGNFIDSYHNLSYKHLMGYKWVLNFCQNAKFVVKTDDDIFIDILRWLDWRSTDLDKLAQKIFVKKIPDIYCMTWHHEMPIRDVKNKLYASFEDWPNKPYPKFCSGWAYGITVDLIEKLYSVSQATKFLWIDDVFATGILMEAIKNKTGWIPEYKDIMSEQEIRAVIDASRPMMCKDQKWNAALPVTSIPRGKYFERDMMCMWNKTLLESTYKWSE